MELIALKRFSYAGVVCSPGDKFPARRKDARALIFIGKASQAPAKVEEPPKEEVQEDPPKKTTRTYKRRDMIAE